MRVLNVTKSINFDRINDVTRFNNIDVSSLYVDKKIIPLPKRKHVNQSNGLKMH